MMPPFDLEPADVAPRVQRIFVEERGYPKQRRAARSAVVDIFANAALRWLCRDHADQGAMRVLAVVR
jgi:hypothetical protein